MDDYIDSNNTISKYKWHGIKTKLTLKGSIYSKYRKYFIWTSTGIKWENKKQKKQKTKQR